MAALAAAGSALQRALCEAFGGPGGIEVALADEDPLVLRAACGLFQPCAGLGAMLVGLAVTLSRELQQPLQDLERAVKVERAMRITDLGELRHQHQACTGALLDSLRRKDQASAELREALERRKYEQTSVRAWLGLADEAAAEERLRSAEEHQRLATNDFAALAGQTMELSEQAQQSEEALRDALGHTDFAVKQSLQTSMRRCSYAWRAVSSGLVASAKQLAEDSSVIAASPAPICLSSKRPTWAYGVFAPTPSTPSPEDTPRAKQKLVETPRPPRLPVGQAAKEPPSPGRQHQEQVLAEKTVELEAQREAQEVREVHLLEREESLRTLQAHLDSHVQQFAQVRRTLALDQARCFALMEKRVSQAECTAGGGSQGPESFSLDGGHVSPPQPRPLSRRPEQLYQQEKHEVLPQELRTPPTSQESRETARSDTDASVTTPAAEVSPGGVDGVWDMDWTLPRTASGVPIRNHKEIDLRENGVDDATQDELQACTRSGCHVYV